VSYRLEIKPFAAKEMRKLPSTMLKRVNARIKSLVENQYASGAKKLAGSPRFRIAVGAYRVIYRIDADSRLVLVLAVRHRREAYR